MTEAVKLDQDIDKRIAEAKKSPYMTEEMQMHIDELEQELAKFKAGQLGDV